MQLARYVVNVLKVPSKMPIIIAYWGQQKIVRLTPRKFVISVFSLTSLKMELAVKSRIKSRYLIALTSMPQISTNA